ncbi:MAG: hypothetical protein ACREND_12895 [Gemmatimonadaceae bacterium]
MKRKRTPGSRVREPIQVYIAADERQLLDSLAAELELSRAEILRRGLKLLAADRAGDAGPMQRLLQSLRDADWPSNVGSDHDAHLAEAYLDRHDA